MFIMVKFQRGNDYDIFNVANLVETSNADSKDLLWKFVKKYKSDISEANFPIFDGLVGYAIKYFNDVIKAQKKYKTPNSQKN